MSAHPPIAYKVLTGAQMAELLDKGSFAGAPVDIIDGFIHLSTAAQLSETVDKHFAGQTELIIAAVDLVLLGEVVRWEPSRGGQLFPHIYAPLPLLAVVAHGPLNRDAAGAIVLPTA